MFKITDIVLKLSNVQTKFKEHFPEKAISGRLEIEIDFNIIS